MTRMPNSDSTITTMHPGQDRTYRRISGVPGLRSFEVRVEETDLRIQADADVSRQCRELVIGVREQLKRFIHGHPGFHESLVPWLPEGPAPPLIRLMAAASENAGVGPMAAVAGAIAETVGTALLETCGQVVVENGGDIFTCLARETVVGIHAGPSPLSMKVGLKIPGDAVPTGICTSSATVGHSLSRGRADAACVISPSAAVADAAATAVANRVGRGRDITPAIEWAGGLQGVRGVVVIKDDRIGMWGAVEVVSLEGKRG